MPKKPITLPNVLASPVPAKLHKPRKHKASGAVQEFPEPPSSLPETRPEAVAPKPKPKQRKGLKMAARSKRVAGQTKPRGWKRW
jgi:hypothetical protein